MLIDIVPGTPVDTDSSPYRILVTAYLFMVGLRGVHGDLHRITLTPTNIDYNLLLILTTVSGNGLY